MICRDLLSRNLKVDAYILSRYYYKINNPKLTDEEYDLLNKEIIDSGMCTEYVNRLYDDDPVPYELLELYNLKSDIVLPELTDSKLDFIKRDKSLSISSVHNHKDAHKVFLELGDVELKASIKVNGQNGKNGYSNCDYVGSLSRGRETEPIDYTMGARMVVPLSLEDSSEELVVIGEFVVLSMYTDRLRRKYSNTSYKTGRTSALSMLRTYHDEQDYNGLMFFAFDYKGDVQFKTVKEKYNYLTSLGFRVPPNIDLPKGFLNVENFDSFCERLDIVLDKLKDASEHYDSDGVVFEVNDLTKAYSEKGVYSRRNVAVKSSHWKAKVYDAVIKDIVLEPKGSIFSCRLLLEELTTDDRCNAEWLNGYNIGLLNRYGIKKGSIVKFCRDSGSYNKLYYRGEEIVENGGD